MMLLHVVSARNDATASENKIHHDDVARRYGFGGGLVPGVTVYGYLTWAPARRWGVEWLERGTITARFDKPVYDGDVVEVRGVDDGDTVRMWNDYGSLEVVARIDADLRVGVVSMPKGLWRRDLPGGLTANALVPDTLNDLAGGACFNDARVEIERL